MPQRIEEPHRQNLRRGCAELSWWMCSCDLRFFSRCCPGQPRCLYRSTPAAPRGQGQHTCIIPTKCQYSARVLCSSTQCDVLVRRLAMRTLQRAMLSQHQRSLLRVAFNWTIKWALSLDGVLVDSCTRTARAQHACSCMPPREPPCSPQLHPRAVTADHPI